MLDEDINDIKTLYARLIDSRKGYQEGIELTENNTVKSAFNRIVELRTRHIAQLDQVLIANGIEPDKDGSWMTLVHKSIMNVRAWVGGLDESVFSGIKTGELEILDAYYEAITGAPVSSLTTLRQQSDEVRALIADIETLETQ